PFNNLNTTLTTLGGLTNFVTGLNLALGNIYKGNWDLVPANLQKAWSDEVAAFQKVLQLPQTLIEYDTVTIQNFVNSLAGNQSSAARSAAAVSPAVLPAAAPTDVTNALLVVLGIPFNNLNTTLTTLGGLTNFVTGLNLALGNIYKGNWDQVPANLQKAWSDEVAAFDKVLQLPQTIVTYNITALQNLVSSLAPAPTSTVVTSERVFSLALPQAATIHDAAMRTGPEPGQVHQELDTADPAAKTTPSVPAASGQAADRTAEATSAPPVGESPAAEHPRSETSAPAEPAAPEREPDAAQHTTGADLGSDATHHAVIAHPGMAGADDSAASAASTATRGEHDRQAPGDDAPYGKHARQDQARQDDAGDTTAPSGPGRHRKPETDSAPSGSSGPAASSSTTPKTASSTAAA
ncbi:hypothetical protein ACTJJE_20955, partial [Mycolicibacterium sp. 22603]